MVDKNTYDVMYIYTPPIRILLSNSIWEQQPKIATVILNLYIYYVLEIYLMVAESDPVREPTNHRCEECGKIFPTAEELTTHYTKDHPESS